VTAFPRFAQRMASAVPQPPAPTMAVRSILTFG
jgi:hypothetical protein